MTEREELVAWLQTHAVRAESLGPCAECGAIVRAGWECSECLEEAGVVVHDRCCREEDR